MIARGSWVLRPSGSAPAPLSLSLPGGGVLSGALSGDPSGDPSGDLPGLASIGNRVFLLTSAASTSFSIPFEHTNLNQNLSRSCWSTSFGQLNLSEVRLGAIQLAHLSSGDIYPGKYSIFTHAGRPHESC